MAMELGGEKVACDMAKRASLRRRSTEAQHYNIEGGPKAGPPLKDLSSDGAKRFATDLAGKRIFHIGNAKKAPDGPIAQLDRVTDFYSVGCRFESCWDRHYLGL